MSRPYSGRVPLPPIDRLRYLFDYDPGTGLLTWRIHRPRGIRPGDEAGTVTRNGYRFVSVGGRKLPATHVIWAWAYGAYPEDRIRFVDGDVFNFKLTNLTNQPVLDSYENKLLAAGFSPAKAARDAEARAEKTAAAILLDDVNKAALNHIQADEPAWHEYCIANRLGKKRIIAKFRNMLRAKYPNVYPTTHLTRGRE